MSAHSHDHDHPHDHAHGHGAVPDSRRAFAIGIVLNIGFVIVEVAAGLYAHSLALLADAGHNFGDVLGLVFAWGAATLATRRPSAQYTYGLRGSTILAALANAMLLAVATGGIVWEAIRRLQAPVPVESSTVIWVALAGVVINTATALLFLGGHKHDLNVRGALLHMAADALVSVGVIIGGVVMLYTGWEKIDPIISLLVAAVILAGAWGVFREAVRLAVHAVPEHVDAQAVREYLQKLDGVREVHDLHIWGMSTTETALTAHLVMPGGHPGDAFLGRICDEIEHDFHIAHATFQIETGSEVPACRLAPEHVV